MIGSNSSYGGGGGGGGQNPYRKKPMGLFGFGGGQQFPMPTMHSPSRWALQPQGYNPQTPPAATRGSTSGNPIVDVLTQANGTGQRPAMHNAYMDPTASFYAEKFGMPWLAYSGFGR